MRCVDCAAELRPVVSIDIDGTLGDYHNHFRRFAIDYLGRHIGPRDTTDYPYEIEFSEWLGLDKTTYREIKLAYRQGGMKRMMPVFFGASGVVSALRSMGVDVWIATTRPWLRLDNIDPDTRHWLARHDIGYDGLLYGDDKYKKLVDLVGRERIIGAVDDLPSQFDAAWAQGCSPILKHNGHKGYARRGPAVDSLAEIISIVDERLKTWQSETTST